jgi:predicted enzyme related to lactoylglutathione lyase
MTAYVDRMAIVVQDLEAAIKDFQDIFGMQFEITEVAELGIRVGVCDQGLELVQKSDPNSPIAPNWAGNAIAALSINVEDYDAVKQKMIDRGADLINEVDVYSLKECIFTKESFHGIPVCIAKYEGSFTEAMHGQHDLPPDFEPKITWFKEEYGPQQA